MIARYGFRVNRENLKILKNLAGCYCDSLPSLKDQTRNLCSVGSEGTNVTQHLKGNRWNPQEKLKNISMRDIPAESIDLKSERISGNIDQYFDLSLSFQHHDEWKNKLENTMLVFADFITPDEEETLMKEIEPYISRLHYEDSHWDDAIHEYRETERSRWNKRNELVINRIRALCFPPGVPQLKLVHILDLAKKGVIKPHIDSVRFCGNTIAGLSLLSDCVMKLRHDVQREFYCDVYLPRYSLYVMKDFARYEFTHEILGDADSIFKHNAVSRNRRISIICRNEPDNTDTEEPIFKAIT